MKGIYGNSAQSHFPANAANWLEYGLRLAGFASMAEVIVRSPHPVPPDFEEQVRKVIGALAADSDLRTRNPRIEPAVNAVAKAIQEPLSKKQYQVLGDTLEHFRQTIFAP
jgi:uncharacterized protein (DUF2267 family)